MEITPMFLNQEQSVQIGRSIVSHLNRRPKLELGKTDVELDAYLARLREYASTWVKAGYRLEEWPMRDMLQKDIQAMTVFLMARPDGQPYVMTVLGHIKPPEPLSPVDLDVDAEQNPSLYCADLEHSSQLKASEIFLRFILSPYYGRIGQCARCGKWFFNSSGKKTRYCSLKCSRLETSNEVKKATREREALNKIQRVEDAIKAFNRLPKTERRAISLRPHGWKGWVAKEARHKVTTNFITRLLNAQRIEPPNEI
jgi:hypothetical protein